MKLFHKTKKCYHSFRQEEGKYDGTTYYYCPDCKLHYAIGPYVPDISGGF
jgi:hypothetical protein